MDSISYGEPMTGGECLIPLRGINSSRSTTLAQTVANTYGLVSNLDTSVILAANVAAAAELGMSLTRFMQLGEIRLPGARDEDDGTAGVPARV